MGNGETLCDLIEEEQVSLALGVPTIWQTLLDYAADSDRRLDALQRTLIGGAAVPRSMVKAFRDVHGVEVAQGWDMTETSPVGVVNTIKPGYENLDDEARLDHAIKSGRSPFGCEMRIVDDDAQYQPWDGNSVGFLQVRGPWVCSEYYRSDSPTSSHTDDGWLNTGDVATIDADGFMTITDRSKDLIKSGGEWISSIVLENIAVGHPSVREAAVIAVPDEKWSERPLLVVVASDTRPLDVEELLATYQGKVVKWWIPDRVVILDELPHTDTGKVRKADLREQLAKSA